MKKSERLRAEADAIQARADALAFSDPAQAQRLLREVRNLRIKQRAAEFHEQALRPLVTKPPD